MSQENVEVVRQQFAALGRADLNAAAAYWDPDIDWRAVEGATDDVGVMRGHDAVRRYYADWLSTFEQLRAEVEDVLAEEGDRVVVTVRNSGLGRASGVSVQGRYWVACTVRGGRIVSGREYASPDEALAAAGLAG